MRTVTCLCVALLIQGCAGKEDAMSGEQKAMGGGKPQEEALIEKTIVEIAHASIEFPRTKDPQSILRFYAQDYTGITDGKSDSLKETEDYLSDVLDRLHLGEPIGISSKVTNIKTSVTGPSGWATYEYEYKLGSGGAVLQTNQGQCTTIFRKQGDVWLIQHEHCSTDSSPTLLSSAQTFLSVKHPTSYQQASGCPIVGNTRSFIYHMPGGQFYSQMHFSPDGVCFQSEAQARSQGYRPSQR